MDNNNQCTIWCLKELGCREDEINRYKKLAEKNDIEGIIKFLSCTRCKFLQHIHEEQRKLDCIDSIIYKLKKSYEETKE